MKIKLLCIITGCFLLIGNTYSQKSWTGAGGNSNWSNAGNWSPAGVPAAGNTVVIGNTFSVNYDANSPNPSTLKVDGTLTINTGFLLTLTGAFSGMGNVLVNGSVSTNSDITITNMAVNGALTSTAAASVMSVTNLSGNGVISIVGSFIPTIFTYGTSTVIYNGTNQNIRAGDYNNVTFSNSGAKSLSGTTNINGTLAVQGNATITCATNNLNLLGSVLYTGSGTINTTANTINYNSTSAQDIIPGIYSGAVSISGTGAKALKGITTINGIFSVASDISCSTFNLTLGNQVVYSSGNISTGVNTITYNSAVSQDIIPGTYTGNMSISGIGSKSLKGNIIINGTYTQAADISCGNNNLTLGNTVTLTSGNLTCGINTVTYSSAANQTIIPSTYNSLVITGGAGTKTLSGITTINSNFSVNTGTIACGTNNFSLLGPVSYTLGTITTGANVIVYNSNLPQDIIPGTYSGTVSMLGSGLKTLKGTTILNSIFNLTSDISSGNFNLTIANAFNYTSGNLTCGTNTVMYSSTLAQTIIPSTYSTLTLTGGGSAKTLSGNTAVTAAFTLNTGSLSCGNNNLTLSGPVTHTAGILTTGTNQVIYNSPATQNLLYGTYTGDIALSGGAKTITSTTTFSGNLSMLADLNCGNNAITINGGVNYTSGTFSTTGNTLTYSGISTQNIITGNIGGNLTISNGAKTLVTAVTPLTVTGTFTMNSDINCGANNVILNGNIGGTYGILTNGLNTVTYGGAAQNIIGANYNNLVLNGTGTKTLVYANNIINGALTISQLFACSNYNLTLNGLVNWSGLGSITTGLSNTVSYNRSGDQNVIPGIYSGSLIFGGNGNRLMAGNITVLTSSIVVPTGINLGLNGFTLTTTNQVSVNVGAELDILSTGTSAQLLIANNKSLDNFGTVKLIGSVAFPAIVGRNAAGNYAINQAGPSAVFHAKNYQINYTSSVTISKGSIDNTNNFSNGSFSNGVAGSQYLNITIDAPSFPTISGVAFNAGPLYNISRTSGIGALQFDDATGVLAGENFDNDDSNPGTLINWNYPITSYYSNPLGTFKAGKLTDWTKNPDGSGGNPASLTDGTASLIIQNSHTVTLDAANGNIKIKELQIGQGISGIMVIGDDATQRTLTILQKLELKPGGIMSSGSIGTPYHIVQVYGNIYNAGSFNFNNAGKNTTLEIWGNAVSIQGAGSYVLNDLTFTAGSISSTAVPLDVRGNVTIQAGAIFNDGNQIISVKGSWNETSTGKRTGNGTVIMNGPISSINSLVTSGGCEFYNLTFSGGGAGSIGDPITVYKDFLVTSNTSVQVNNYAVGVAGNFTVDPGSTYQHISNTTTLNGTTAQTLSGLGTAVFSNLTLTNGAPFSKTITGSATITGQLAIMTGSVTDGNADLTIANGLRLDGICNWNGSVNLTGGTIITNNISNAATLGTALLKINGNVYMGLTVATNPFQLNIANDLLIQTGYLVLPNLTSLAALPTNNFVLSPSTNLYIRGSNNFPAGFATYTLAPNTIVHYDWNQDQTVRGGLQYGNIDLTATSFTKTADGPLTTIGYLDLNNGVNLNMNNFPLTVGAHIYNQTSSTIDASNSTVTMNALDANQTIETGTYKIKDLIFTLDGATVSRTKNIQTGTSLTLYGNLSVSNLNGTPSVYHILDLSDNNITGTPTGLVLGSYCQLNTSNVAFNMAGTKNLDVTSTFYYSLNGAQDIANGFTYGNILFNTGTKTTHANLDINGNISGTGTPIFVDGGYTHSVAGNWNLGVANYTAASATGTVVLDGADQNVVTTNFQNLVVNNSGTITQLGTVNIFGNLTLNDNSNYDANSQTVNISGNWITPNTGIFTQSTGTVNFIGAVNQTISSNINSNIYNLTINKPNSIGNQTVKATSDMVITGNTVLTTNAGVLDFSGQKIRMGGRLTINPNSVEPGLTMIADNSTVYFDGAFTQYIYNSNANPITFNDVEFSNSGPKLFGWNALLVGTSKLVDFKGNVTINGTAVNSGGWTYDMDFNVAGNWTNNGSFTQNATRTTTFYGTDQTISSSTFGSTAFIISGTKTLTGNITVYGGLTIGGTAILDPNNNNINVSGNWDNSAVGSQFNSNTGTVIFEGGGSTITTGTIAGPSSGKSFNNVILNKLAGNTANLAGDMEVKGDLSLNSGIYQTNAYGLWLNGNLFNAGGSISHNNNTSILTFNATGGNKTFDPGPASSLRGIHIIAPGTTYTLMNNFTISQAQDFTMDGGYFDLNAHSIQLNSTNQRIVLNSGTFDIDPGASLVFNGTTQSVLNNGGVFKLVGTSTQFASINRLSGTYTITQTAGMFHASNYKIDYTNGVTISGGNIDATNNFSDGTFSSGTGTFYLNVTGLDLGGGITTSNTVFNSGPTYNVRRLSGNGLFTFADATGSMSGETFDDDNGNPGNVLWTTPGGFYWDGGAGSSDWNDALNWSGDVVPNGTNNVYLNHKYVVTPYTVKITTNNATAARVILDTQAGTPITLQLENGKTLDVNGSVVININTTLNVTSPASIINVAGNWSNAGTFNHGNSSVIFEGITSFYTIATGGNGVGKKFNNLTVNAPGSTYALTSTLDCDANISVNAGILDFASPLNDVWVGGNWFVDVNNSASILPNQADVTFDGINQSITNGSFYNFLTLGSGTKLINSNLSILGSVTIGAGTTINGQDKNIFVGVNWNNNGGTLLQTSLGSINFNGTGNQNVDNGTSATTFNNIEFLIGGTKTLFKSITVNGEFGVNPGSGLVDASTFQITGIGTNTFICGNGTNFRIRAVNNFPNNFANVNLSASSTIQYFSDLDQTIRVSPTWSYGNLYLADATNLSAPSTKTCQMGDLTITGSLTVADIRTLLDMNANSSNMLLSNNINFPSGGLQIKWGTGTSTLTQIGINDWVIDRDITGFNNLILAGYGNKWLQGDLAITGNVLVKNGVYLRMQENWGPPLLPHIITGLAGKTYQMENGSYTICSIGSGTMAAFPTGFGIYALGVNSTTILNGTIDQTVYTGNGIIYGNLDLGGTYRNVALDGIANLDINGYFNSNQANLTDNGKNMSVAGSYAYINFYVPTPGTTFNLDGIGNQTLYDGATNATTNTTFDLANINFSGSGIKTFGDGNDVINITGNFSNANGVTVTSGRNITFTGTNWDNKGIFQHTGGTITFDQASAVSINPGPANAINYFNAVTFSSAGTKTFITNGADINNTFTIVSGTTDMGTFTHKLAGNIINNTGGVWTTYLAKLIFDGGNQNINTPPLTAANIQTSTNGTKRLFSNWIVNGDLTIDNLTGLNTSDLINPSYDINVRKNWICNGTFTCNTSKVTFDGNTSPVNITTNGSNFYNVEFKPSSAVQYNFLSPLSRISRVMDLRVNATVNLNSNTLILGSNIASGKIFTVEGTLNINENSFLKFNNQTSQSVMNVTGVLNAIGTSSTNIATISREVGGVAGAETQINILSGGKMASQYYLIEYLQDAGLIFAPGSTLDAINNFSNGKFSNIRIAANVCYLNLEANYTGGSINNICFDFSGTPVQGTHFNVRRNVVSPAIQFSQVSGNLGSYLFEDDDLAPAAATGLLRWPGITATNWIGGLSTDWHTAGNWSNGVPTLLLDAIVPRGTPNDPQITNGDAVCKNLNITNGRVTLDNNKKLTTAGDIFIGGAGTNNGILAVITPASEIACGGFWTRGASGMFVHGNGTVRLVSSAGTANINPLGSPFYNLILDNPSTTFYLIGGSPTALTVNGSINVNDGTLTPTTNNYIYNVEGDFTVGTGTFTPTMGAVTAGKVAFTGSGNQNITNATFYNLDISGSNTKATHGPIIVNNLTTVNSTLKAESGSNITFNGDVVINAAGTFNDGNETHTFNGTTWTGTGSYSGNGTVVFARTTSNQFINASKFNNLDINCQTKNLTFAGNVNLTGDITIRAGVPAVYFSSYLLTSTASAGNFEVESNTRLSVTGADNFPAGFSNYDLDLNSNTYYEGAMDQVVAGIGYGNLYFQYSNTKTLKGDISISNTLNFGVSTFDVSPNNYNINLTGTWNNNSTGVFIPRNGEVLFSGSAATQPITVNATAVNPFWNVTVDKTAGTVQPGSAVTYSINNNLVVNNGRFNANGRIINIGNDLLANAGTFANSGTYFFNKLTGTSNIQSNGSIFNNITIDAGTSTIVALDNLRADGNFTLTNGTFDGNGKVITLGNNYNVISIDGTYKVGAGGTLALGYYCTFTVDPGGVFEAVGAPGSTASVTRNVNNTWVGGYRFTINGTIKAKYALFEYMFGQTEGIYIASSGTIDPVNNFSYSTFNNGTTTGAMLTIENTQSLTGANAITDVSFPINPGGTGRNVRKTIATTGIVEFYNAVGTFAGENLDDDPLDLIHWTGPITLTWNGSLSTDWFNSSNWTASSGPGFVPTGAENVFIAPAINQPILTTFGATTAHLTINPLATLTLNTPADGGVPDLIINGDIIITGTLREVSANDYISIKGNWTRTGNTLLNGNIIFNGAGASKFINNGNFPFYNLTISGTTNYIIANTTIIKNDVLVTPGGQLETPAWSTIYIGGNWTNQGSFNAITGRVVFNSTAGVNYIDGGSSSFFDVDINAGSNYLINGILSTMRTLTVNGTLGLNGKTLNSGDGTGVDYLNVNGILNVDANSFLRLGGGSNLQVNTGGLMNIIGTDASNIATVTCQSASNYAFEVASGGTLAAMYYNISRLNANGLYMRSGATIDPVNNLSEGTFDNGMAGGTYLKFENDFGGNTLTIADVTFNTGATYNVTRLSGNDMIFMKDAAGTSGTFLQENDQTGIPDPNTGLIHWTYVNTYIWTGAIDRNWHNPGNWITSVVPDITKSAIIPLVTNEPLISTGPAVSKNISLYTGAFMDINNQPVTLSDDIINDGIISVTGNPIITLAGSWNGTTGTFNSGNSKVIFNATGGNKNIFLGTGDFYDFEITSAPTALYKFGAQTLIRHNMKITSGKLDGSTYDLTVGGFWDVSGSFTPGLKTVTLNAATGTNTLHQGSNSFYNLTINSGNNTGNALFTMAGPLNVTSKFTLRKGTLDVSSDGGVTSNNINIGNRSIINGGTLLGRAALITVGENWQVSNPGIFTCGTSTVLLNAVSGSRSITPGSSPFYILNINTGGTYKISTNTFVNNNLNILTGILDVSVSPTYNLTVGGNWTNNGTFSPQIGTVTFNGATQSINKTSGEIFYKFIATNGTQLTLLNNVSVSNNISLNNAVITTGANTFTSGISNAVPGSFTYTTGKIIGKFQRWITATGTYRFPMGTLTDINIADININSGLTAGSLVVEYIPLTPGNSGLPLTENGLSLIGTFTEGYWNTTAKNGFAVGNFNIALQGNGFISNAFNTETRIVKRNNSGPWTLDGNHGVAGSPWAYRNLLTGGISTTGTQFGFAYMDCIGGAVTTFPLSICANNDIPAFINNASAQGGANNFTYVWQYSTSATAIVGDASWTDISPSNTLSYDYGTLSLTTKFVRKTTGVGCTGIRYSNILNITVTPLPTTGIIYRQPN